MSNEILLPSGYIKMFPGKCSMEYDINIGECKYCTIQKSKLTEQDKKNDYYYCSLCKSNETVHWVDRLCEDCAKELNVCKCCRRQLKKLKVL